MLQRRLYMCMQMGRWRASKKVLSAVPSGKPPKAAFLLLCLAMQTCLSVWHTHSKGFMCAVFVRPVLQGV